MSQENAEKLAVDGRQPPPADQQVPGERLAQPTARKERPGALVKTKEEDGAAVVQMKPRKGSTVSFREQMETIEISSNADDLKPAVLSSMRYYVILLALASSFVSNYSRTIINFAVIDMIDPNFSTVATAELPAETNRTEAYFDLDGSCPVSDEVRTRLVADLAQDERRAVETQGEKFQWDTVKQGQLKAAYTFGHSLLQVVGGRLSEIYGSHLILSLGSIFIGLSCLLAPCMAAADFYLLFLNLFAQGLLGSFITPALFTLFSNWLTPGEKSLAVSLYLVFSRLGFALSAVLCGLLIQAQLSWRYLFYSAGWIALAFAALFSLLLKSRPQDHFLMSANELGYLASKNRLVRESRARALEQEASKKIEAHELKTVAKADQSDNAPKAAQTKAPWFEIMTNRAVWAFVITKFCVKLAGDTVQIELPTYLKRVMHFTAQDNGFLNASNYVIFCISCILIGTLARVVNKRQLFGSKTTSRKVFQCFASFGVSLVLVGISFSVCNGLATRLLLLLMFLVTTFGTGGEAQIPLDISERYSGTIHAIGSSLAVSGAIEPILVGYVTKGHASDRDRWALVWLGASAVSFVGGLVFLFLGDASIQSFDGIGVDPEKATPPREKKLEVVVRQVPLGKDNEAFENEADISSEAGSAKTISSNGKPHRESREI